MVSYWKRVLANLKQLIKKKYKYYKCILLHFGLHDWTCAAAEGIKPTPEQLEPIKRGELSGFYDYSKMYCKRCDHVYVPRDR